MSEPTTIHANALLFGETGLLIRGRSGSGKSRLTLGLIAEAERRGWFGALVADDRVRLTLASGRVVMRPHPAIAGRIERRGLGIEIMAFAPAAVLTAVIDLAESDPVRDIPPRLPDPAMLQTSILSLSFPRLSVPEREPAADVALSLLSLLQNAARPRDFACDFFRAAQDGAPQRGSPG